MEYRTLHLSCECGRVPPNISGVGFTSSHDLVIHWRCPRCHNNVYIVKPLLDCWLECSTEALAVPSNSSLRIRIRRMTESFCTASVSVTGLTKPIHSVIDSTAVAVPVVLFSSYPSLSRHR